MTLRPLAIAACAAFMAGPAFAQLDSGEIYFSHRGLISVTASPIYANTPFEMWIMPRGFVDTDAPNGAESILSGTRPKVRASALRCADYVAYDFATIYTPVEGLPSLADAVRDGARTEQVRIDDAVVGWRLLWGEGDTRSEVWVLTADYAPPRPARTPADLAFARGWLRAYVSEVSLVVTDPAQVAEELRAYDRDPRRDEGRMSEAQFTLEPLTRAECAALR